MVALIDIVREWLDSCYAGYEWSSDDRRGYTCFSWTSDQRHICVNRSFIEIYDSGYVHRLHVEAANPEFFTILEDYMSGKLVLDKEWEAI